MTINTKNTMNITNCQPLTLSRKSPFLRTLLDPESGPASIPDDVSTRHVIKAESITEEIAVVADSTEGPIGNGLFVILPNTPLSNVGAHYRYDASKTRYTFDKYIRVSQDLRDSYDYSRHASFGVKILQNSLSTTSFVLQGTFNAINYQGTFSELGISSTQSPSTFYNTLLANTSNINDKIGNVRMSDGIYVLAIPDSFNVPFTRLSDKTPYSQSNPGETTATIIDNSANLLYNYSQTFDPPTQLNGFKAAMNFDMWEGPVQITMSADGTESLVRSVTYTFQLKLISPFGETIKTINIDVNSQYGSSLVATAVLEAEEPVGSFQVSCIAIDNHNAQEADPEWNTMRILVSSVNGARPGINTPVVFVPYNGANSGTVITVTGVKNYELVPNPVLRKNITTMYTAFDPEELNYAKRLLSMRDALGIRSVMSLPMYNTRKAYYSELPDVDRHEAAMAFSWGDLVRGIKRVAVPALSTLFPELKPMIGLAGNLAGKVADRWSPQAANAASGIPPALASNEDFTGYVLGEEIAWASTDPTLGFITDLDSDFDIQSLDSLNTPAPNQPNNEGIMPSTQMTPTHLVSYQDLPGHIGVLFPTIIGSKASMTRAAMYAVMPGDHRSLLGPASKNVYYYDKGTKKKIYGYCADQLPFSLLMDMTLVPIMEFTDRAFTVPMKAPYVAGGSCQCSIYMLQRLLSNGKQIKVKPDSGMYGPITGDLINRNGSLELNSCPAYAIKKSYCASRGLNLIGSRIETTNLNVVWAKVLAIKGATTNRDITLPVVELAYPSSDGEIAFAAEFSLADLGKMLTQMSANQDMLVQRMDRMESSRGPVITPRKSRIDQRPTTDEYYKEYTSDDEEEDLARPTAPRSIISSRSSSMVRDRSSSARSARVTSASQTMLYALEDAVKRGCTEAQIIRVLDALVPGRERGPDQQTAQYNKAVNVLNGLPNYWKTYFTDNQLIEWIIENGYRGASAAQNQAMRLNNKYLPQTGVNNTVDMPRPEPVDIPGVDSLPQFNDYKLNMRWNNFVRSNAGLVNRHPDFIDVAYSVIQAKQALPNADEMAVIKSSLDPSLMKVIKQRSVGSNAKALIDKYQQERPAVNMSRAASSQSTYFDIGNTSGDV